MGWPKQSSTTTMVIQLLILSLQVEKEKKPLFVEKQMGAGDAKGKRLVRVKKNPRTVRPEGTKKPRQRKTLKAPKSKEKLRSSLVPGTVCILLAGRHRGKRVVFMKQLRSGLLLVNG